MRNRLEDKGARLNEVSQKNTVNAWYIFVYIVLAIVLFNNTILLSMSTLKNYKKINLFDWIDNF